MTKEEAQQLSQEIEDISNHFENTPWTANVRSLQENFDSSTLNSPTQYLKTIEELEEVLREGRLLFIHSVLHQVCLEEAKLYNFEIAYQAAMRYTAVMKKEGQFYLLDEDGDYSEISASENFMRFIDESYWELYE